MHPRRSARSGFSLLEVLIVLALLGVVLGSVALVSKTSTQALNTGTTATALEESVHQAMERILARLPTSNRDSVSPTPEAPAYASSIDFVPSDGYANGAIQWADPERIAFEYTAADPDDGLDNDGNGLIDDGQVVWIRSPGTAQEQRLVLCHNVPELFDGESANGDDDNGNGLEDETGLSFDFQGSTVTVRLTLEAVGPQGVHLTRTATRAMAFRNGDS